MTSTPNSRIAAWVILGLTVVLATVSIRLAWPPAPLPATAPANQFSAERAFRHVEVIAARPHGYGTKENEAVRDYLVAELRQLGLDPQIHRGHAVFGQNRTPGTVENIVVRKPGTANTGAVMLVAHYDSHPRAPGASDNGAAVAAILETLRALSQEPALRNDLIVLFPDAEEYGLKGAQAFMAEHPWAKDVKMVVNFDARGVRGPSLMFETSDRNGTLIHEFDAATTRVAANALFTFAYAHMKNNTDFTVFRLAGIPGLNFAFIGGAEHYHQTTDNPAHLDRGTLQETGEHALSLTRHFGNLTLPLHSRGNATYFNLIGASALIHYPARWIIPFACLMLVLAVAVSWTAAREHRHQWRSSLFALLWMIVPPLLAGALCWGIVSRHTQLVKALRSTDSVLAAALVTSGLIVAIGYWLGRRRLSRIAVGFASLWGWTMVAATFAFALPDLVFLALWPALVGWIVAACLVHRIETCHCPCAYLPYVAAIPVLLSVSVSAPLLALLLQLWTGLKPALPIVAAVGGWLLWNVLLLVEDVIPARRSQATAPAQAAVPTRG